MADNNSEIQKVLKSQTQWENLFFYQKSDVVYQMAFVFCDKYIHLFKDRTRDQVIQAARSCKQNIVEGLADGITSTEMQLKLLNVARASLQELREDFKDYLISRKLHFFGLPPAEREAEKAREAKEASSSREAREARISRTASFSRNSSYARYKEEQLAEQATRPARSLRGSSIPAHYYDGNKARYDMMLAYCRSHNRLEDYEPFFNTWTDEELCNYALTLCHMIDRMMMTFMEKLETEFITEGGIKERMYKARTGYRQAQDDRLKQLEAEHPQLVDQLEQAQAEAAHWKAAYEDLKQRALNAYHRQQEERDTLKKKLEGLE